MERETMGSSIARMRKEKGLTQAQLAEMMHVTDKAVSKWERAHPEASSTSYLVYRLIEELWGAESVTKEMEIQPESCINMLDFMYLWLPMILNLLITILLSFLTVEKANKQIPSIK